jgi:hypothetical protein
MAISFPVDVDVLDVPFSIVPNPDFLGESTPLCILRNMGAPKHPARFIVTGPAAPPRPFPEGADPWEIEFHWATAGPAVPGFWVVDAWLASATSGTNLHVPAAGALPQVVPTVANQRYNHIVAVPASAVPLPPITTPLPAGFLEPFAARLYRLYTVIRFFDVTNFVRVACRGEGPLIEFYQAE